MNVYKPAAISDKIKERERDKKYLTELKAQAAKTLFHVEQIGKTTVYVSDIKKLELYRNKLA